MDLIGRGRGTVLVVFPCRAEDGFQPRNKAFRRRGR